MLNEKVLKLPSQPVDNLKSNIENLNETGLLYPQKDNNQSYYYPSNNWSRDILRAYDIPNQITVSLPEAQIKIADKKVIGNILYLLGNEDGATENLVAYEMYYDEFGQPVPELGSFLQIDDNQVDLDRDHFETELEETNAEMMSADDDEVFDCETNESDEELISINLDQDSLMTLENDKLTEPMIDDESEYNANTILNDLNETETNRSDCDSIDSSELKENCSDQDENENENEKLDLDGDEKLDQDEYETQDVEAETSKLFDQEESFTAIDFKPVVALEQEPLPSGIAKLFEKMSIYSEEQRKRTNYTTVSTVNEPAIYKSHDINNISDDFMSVKPLVNIKTDNVLEQISSQAMPRKLGR